MALRAVAGRHFKIFYKLTSKFNDKNVISKNNSEQNEGYDGDVAA
jgi:hypothetical protein